MIAQGNALGSKGNALGTRSSMDSICTPKACGNALAYVWRRPDGLSLHRNRATRVQRVIDQRVLFHADLPLEPTALPFEPRALPFEPRALPFEPRALPWAIVLCTCGAAARQSHT